MSLLDQFIEAWEFESQGTLRLLGALPVTQYEFRPDAGGRSLGELAWHLPELEAYTTFGIERGSFELGVKPPNIERPRTIEALAPGFERVHAEAVARLRKANPDFDRTLKFFNGREMTISTILWGALLHHLIHHRGQLHLMCRLAGGKPPGLYGPTREEMAARQG
jgi:uncharacterized damage-inducible protein DinB